MNWFPLSGVKATILVSIGIGLLFSTGVNAAEKGGPPSLAKSYIRDSGKFDGNRIRDDLENNGMIVSQRITGHSGMEWPKGTFKYINYASGIWVAGKVGGDIRTAVGEYAPEFSAGPYGGDASAPEHQLYIVNKSDLADPLASSDFQNWPADLGAPWVDEDGDGVYSPLPLGPDHPEFLGDQVIWWVMNDAVQAEHSVFNTLPLGIEMQMTIWGYDRPDAFGDMMFIKALIINKGGISVDSTIIGLWSDPDLGYAGDDFVGCDTTLGLGFCYNDGPDADYGSAAPAIGYDFFQGPIVPSPGDTAFAFGREIPDYKNLVMSSFTKYINGDPVYTDPNDAVEAYNYMSGFLRNGVPYINSATGLPSKFVHPDDPNDNIDGADDVWVDSDDHASGDRRFLMNAGPFTLADGDSQEVVFGIIIAQGASALGSVTALKEVDALAQLAYDLQFALPESPGAPEVTYSTQGAEINLMWDTAQEDYAVPDLIDMKFELSATTETKEMQAVATIIDQYVYGFAFDDTMGVGLYRTTDTTISTDPLIVLPVNLTGYKEDSTYASPVILLGTVSDTFFTTEQVVVAVDTQYVSESTKYEFEGYNVYQFDNASGTGIKKRVATFDKANGVTDIQDVVFDAARGENLLVTVQPGSDSGIRNHLTITGDALLDGAPLKTNRAYYFAVTTYGYNPYGIPKVLESSPKIMTIRPAISTDYDVGSAGAEELTEEVEHSVGISDGQADVVVVDPLEVTGHDYEVYFTEQAFYLDADGEWQAGGPPSKRLGKVLDLTGSSVAATAYVAGGGAGTVSIDFDVTLVAVDGDFADGFMLTFPAGIVIKSASVSGAINSDNQTPGFETATIDPTANTVLWGNSSISTWGAIEGNATFSVVVKPFDLPLSVDWELYDDGWAVDYGEPYASMGDGVLDATGTATISALVYDTKTLTVWNVKDLETGQDVVSLQTIVVSEGVEAGQTVITGEDRLRGTKYSGGDDATYAFFDGIKVRVFGAPPHTLSSWKWVEEGGTVSPAFGTVEEYIDANGNGKFDFKEEYKDFGVDKLEDVLEEGHVPPSKHNPDPSGDNYILKDIVIFEDVDGSYGTEDEYTIEANKLGEEGNGVWNPWPEPEPYTDTDVNGKYDLGEPFEDVGPDSLADADERGYKLWVKDAAEDNYLAAPDTFSFYPILVLPAKPMGTEGNKKYDAGELYTDANENDQWDDQEEFVDANDNGSFDGGYPDDGRWLVVTDEDGPDEGGYALIGRDFKGTDAIKGDAYPTVELRFVEMDAWTDADANGKWDPGEPYTFDTTNVNASKAAMYNERAAGYYRGFYWVPFKAWNMDTDPPTPLQIALRERDKNDRYDPGLTIYNYIYITNEEYTGDPVWDDVNDFMALYDEGHAPMYYALWLAEPTEGKAFARSGTFTFTPSKDNVVGEKFTFSTKGAVAMAFDMDAINVWPNPYFAYNQEERTPVERIMQFTHLPGTATIRIFNLAGQLVRKIDHADGTQYETWDLTNNFNIPVASGMYIAYIYSEEYGDKILKLAVIQAEQRLDVY